MTYRHKTIKTTWQMLCYLDFPSPSYLLTSTHRNTRALDLDPVAAYQHLWSANVT
jgi:hypothetical protein